MIGALVRQNTFAGGFVGVGGSAGWGEQQQRTEASLAAAEVQ